MIYAQGTTLKMNADALNTVAELNSEHAMLCRVSSLAQVKAEASIDNRHDWIM